MAVKAVAPTLSPEGPRLVLATGGGDDVVTVESRPNGGARVEVNGKAMELDRDSAQRLTVRTGAGDDVVRLKSQGLAVKVETGAGDDVVENRSLHASVDTGAGDDRVDGRTQPLSARERDRMLGIDPSHRRAAYHFERSHFKAAQARQDEAEARTRREIELRKVQANLAPARALAQGITNYTAGVMGPLATKALGAKPGEIDESSWAYRAGTATAFAAAAHGAVGAGARQAALGRAGVVEMAANGHRTTALVVGSRGRVVRGNEHIASELRAGRDVQVKTVEEARSILASMPELRPVPAGRLSPNPDKGSRNGFSDPRGTYRGDLINTGAPEGPVHPGNANRLHAENPHYNVTFPDGTRAAIIIGG